MEASGSDGSLVSWSYRDQNACSSYAIGSPPSTGTVVSTTCTSPSIADTAATMEYLGFESDEDVTETKEVRVKHIKILVQDFFGAPSTSYCSINNGIGDGDAIVLERWFDQLGVGWVIHVANGASLWELQDALSSWTRALAKIKEAIRLVASLRPDHGSPSICDCEKEELEAATGNEASILPDQFQFARFIEITMMKMLAFVDFIVAPDTTTTTQAISTVFGLDKVPPLPYENLGTLLGVRGALSKVLTQIRLSFHWPPSAEIQRIQSEVVSLLSAKEGKVREAIWTTMEDIRTRVLESTEVGDDSSTSLTAQGSSDIDEATRRVMSYIKFLKFHYSSVAPIVSEEARLGLYVPRIIQEHEPPLINMIIEIASCLEEKLANKSESFQDEHLKALFLLNNSYFVLTELKYSFLSSLTDYMAALTYKVEAYRERYIEVSWAPILSCLFNSTSTPVCLGRNSNYTPLSKFDSEFQKIYTTQKQWKVPHPVLRMKLRKAISNKIVPDYTTYVEDNKVTTPKFSPLKMEVMLQGLFEG